MATLTLAQKIADAEARYHDLMTGQAVSVFVDQNGERVEYSRASASRLAQYIDQLKKQRDGDSRRRGPMKVWLS